MCLKMSVSFHCLLIWIGFSGCTGTFHSLEKAHTMESKGLQDFVNSAQGIPLAQRRILNDLPLSLRLTLLKDFVPETKLKDKQDDTTEGGRKVDVQALVLPNARRDDFKTTEAENDDNNMKMKLFRLMYETVRDSDLKVKRAELIKRSYANSSSFEIGYLLGDITDKFNIMRDIGLTLKRLYHEWKPIEHINAYEQIANLGIDVSHIVDMVKGVEKRTKPEDNAKPSTSNTAGSSSSSKQQVAQKPDPDYFDIPGK